MDTQLYNFRRISVLKSMPLMAVDGEIGRTSDIYFDDLTWRTRYLVADIGSWLENRRVLISPLAISSVDDTQINLSLTKEQIENSPAADWSKPVSRQYETTLFDYYRWEPYWRPALIPGDGGGIMVLPPLTREAVKEQTKTQQDQEAVADPHLRSAAEVLDYSIEALDGSIGHLEDFVVNLDTWRMRFFAVDTRNWLPGKKTILPPSWIDDIDWTMRSVKVDLSQESIRNAPELDIDKLNEDFVSAIYRHFNRKLEPTA